MQLEKLQDQKPECHLEWPNLLSLLLRENNCLVFLRVMPINFCRVLITFTVRDMRSDR